MKKRTIYNKVILIAISANICILILLSTVFGCLFWNYSKAEKIDSTMNRLDAVESACGILLEGVFENMTYLSGGEELDSFTGALWDVSKAENIIIVRDMIQNLQNFVNTNNRIFSMYLYIEESDWVLTSDGKVVKGADFSDYGIINYYNEKRKAGESTGSLVSRIPRRQNYINAEMYEPHAVISMCSPLTAYTTKLNGLLIINLYESAVSEILNGEQENDESYVYLMNADGTVLSHTIHNTEAGAVSDKVSQKIIESNEEKGYIYDSIDGKKVLVSYKKSQVQNLIYIGVNTFSSLIGRLMLMIILSILVILLVAGLSVMIVYATTKKVVAPMNRLVDEMIHKAKIEPPAEIDEVDILKAAYNAIDQKAKQMETILVRSKDAMREHILLKMVNAQADDADRKYISDIFPYESCTVLLIAIDKYSEISVIHSMEQIKIMQETILHNVKRQLSKYNYITDGFWQNNGSIVIVVNLSQQEPDTFYSNAANEHRFLAEMLLREYGVSISMAAGNIYSREELDAAYPEAQIAINERMFSGSGSFIRYSDIEKKDTTYYYPILRQKHLFNYLKTAMCDKITECIEGMFGDIREKQNELSYENVIQIFTQLAADLIKYIAENNMDIGSVFNDCKILNINFAEMETLDNIEQWFRDVFLSVASYQQKYQNEAEDYVGRTLSYIKSNYTSDIDLVRMSEHLGVSYSYIRKKFKEMTGETLSDYINKMRMEAGKTLLAETDLTIYEIALRTGYNNDQSFSRFFKKYEGVTPGQFRDHLRGNDETAD